LLSHEGKGGDGSSTGCDARGVLVVVRVVLLGTGLLVSACDLRTVG
jgi:hypothetical protein